MVHVAALIRELMRQSQDAQENAHQNYCWAEKKREIGPYWDFVVAHCDKKLTLARNYIDKITNCKNKQSENEEEKCLPNFRKKISGFCS